jgi:hypothetical protein
MTPAQPHPPPKKTAPALPVELVLGLPMHAPRQRDHLRLLRAAHGVVMRSLGDLEVALADSGGAAAALARLPLDAVARLLASDALRAASECSVVAAIGAWVGAQGGADAVGAEVGAPGAGGVGEG